MSTAVFPSTQLPGMTFNIERNVQWNTTLQESASGKETAVAYWASAKYTWRIPFEFLRDSTLYSEFQTLFGFFNARQGMYDTFQYLDVIDNSVTAQPCGFGTSTNTVQLYRTFGGFTDQVLAPKTVSNVTVGGSTKSSTTYIVNYWESSAPGTIRFSTFAPSSAQLVDADITYYWPCRFTDDVASFNNFMTRLWETKSLEFRSVK